MGNECCRNYSSCTFTARQSKGHPWARHADSELSLWHSFSLSFVKKMLSTKKAEESAPTHA